MGVIIRNHDNNHNMLIYNCIYSNILPINSFVFISYGYWRCLEWDRLNIAPRFFYPVYSAHLLKIMETVIIVILMLLLLL